MSSVSETNAYSNAARRQQESYDAERAQTRANHEREVDGLKENLKDQKESANAEYNERIARVRSEANDEVRKLKEEMYDKSGKKFINDARELGEERSKINQYHDEIERNANKRVRQAEDSALAKSKNASAGGSDQVEQALAAQKRSHREELNGMRDEVEIYRSRDHDVAKEKALARQEVVQQNEGEQIHERDRLTTAYEQRINRLHEKAGEREDYFSRQLTDATIEGNARASGEIRTQKEEFSRLENERAGEAKRLQGHYEEQVKNERNRNTRSEGTLIQRNSEDVNRSLAQKDLTYQDYLKESSNTHSVELSQRDQEIAKLKTTDDPLKVSPFVVQKINTAAEKRSDEQLKAAQEIHHQNLDAERTRDQDERQELRDTDAQRYAQTNRGQQQQRDVEKRQFLSGFTDLKLSKEQEAQQMKDQHADRMQRTTMKHSNDMTLQQRKFKDEMEVQRSTLIESKQALQSDLEIKNRGQERDWAVRLNQVRRDHDRKLMDEHDSNEKLVSELKFSFDKKLQDLARTSKKALDDRVKAYEHQITQQEVAFKERERFLTEHYEEELDSMRRTNARLIQKKS